MRFLVTSEKLDTAKGVAVFSGFSILAIGNAISELWPDATDHEVGMIAEEGGFVRVGMIRRDGRRARKQKHNEEVTQ